MTDLDQIPWQQRDAHGDLVLEMRSTRRAPTGDTEGSLTEEIRVRHNDGRILLDRKVTLHWQHFGQINAGFSDDGASVVVTTSAGRDRVWALS
ncbi:hypothetical protein SAMN05444000_10773 [Shimia gijangensis]|uniref:Uncharacterized protein n=1 Tax=Shimia gijangensis TaxID=1470563 RepID=A0A1M6ID78_9RHOB|nr:hypothetical protein [Shimia gijangensis]SHJ32375.1 hypothetical protein SAMN05444000_10773 [Shimia gijangensis]